MRLSECRNEAPICRFSIQSHNVLVIHGIRPRPSRHFWASGNVSSFDWKLSLGSKFFGICYDLGKVDSLWITVSDFSCLSSIHSSIVYSSHCFQSHQFLLHTTFIVRCRTSPDSHHHWLTSWHSISNQFSSLNHSINLTKISVRLVSVVWIESKCRRMALINVIDPLTRMNVSVYQSFRINVQKSCSTLLCSTQSVLEWQDIPVLTEWFWYDRVSVTTLPSSQDLEWSCADDWARI
jgi:hypothetical protein